MSELLSKSFGNLAVKDYGFAGIGMRTGDNNRFLRFWYEVGLDTVQFGCKNSSEQINSHSKWIPYNKGGEFRKWYGNNEYVVLWENNGFAIKENTRIVYPALGNNLGWKISNESYYYRQGITWSSVTTGLFGCRCYENGFIFDSGANGLFAYDDQNRLYLAGLLNSNFSNYVLKILNPTINCGAGTLNQVPVIMDDSKKSIVDNEVQECIQISQSDWDSFENSWNFKKHPLI